MRYFIYSIILFVFLVSCGKPNKGFIPASHGLIEYTGRIDFSQLDTPTFSYSGVSIRVCFKGNGISAILKDEKGENYYYIILDGKVIERLKPDKGIFTYPLVSGLNNSIHEIEIFKLTEEMFGKTGFCGFILDKNTSIVKNTNKRKILIEYIGNSITCGFGNEGTPEMTFGAATENHYLTYAAINSRYFNARHLAVCKSGIGIYRNYNGPPEGNIDCMPNYYSRIFLYDENPKYSFKEKPDLICINLGTNDFSTTGGDSARFVEGYLNFIDSIQAKYSNPEILCILGPMINGDPELDLRKYLVYITESANSKGKGKVNLFQMSPQTGELGFGISYHPTIAQHKKNAKELAEFISRLKDWEILNYE